MLYFRNRLYLPNNNELKTEIGKGCIDSQVARHFAMEKTIDIITREIDWEKLTQWMNDYVQSYDQCQHNKSPRHGRWRLLQPLETPYVAWTSISTNFITHLPEFQ